VLNLSNLMYSERNDTIFRLILYSLESYVPFVTNDFQSFQDQLRNLTVRIVTDPDHYVNGYNYIYK
jgi:hypothetical protein